MKINNSYILLKDICCFAYHGVAPQENIIGNEYIINLKLKVDISQAICPHTCSSNFDGMDISAFTDSCISA